MTDLGKEGGCSELARIFTAGGPSNILLLSVSHLLKAALGDHSGMKKKRMWIHDSKKLGCTATMNLRKITYYPDLPLPTNASANQVI